MNQNTTAPSSRQPPGDRRDVCSIAWRCWFLAARRSQHVCVHPTHGLICTQAPAAGKPCAVLFWGKYAKGDYRTMVHVSYLMRALPELQVLGVSCDAAKEDCEAMLKKNGTAMPTQSIDELIFDMSLAFDEGKKVKEAFAAIGKAPAPGFLFLFDKNGVLVWKEVFTGA